MSRHIESQREQWPHRVAALTLPQGRRIRVRIAMPMPTSLQLSADQPEYTGSHGMQVHEDEQGQWSFKQPKPSLAFTVPLEASAASLQRSMGLEAPESYAITHNGRPAVVSKWYPNSTQAFQKPPRLAELSPEDQMAIQKNHVLDWLIGNHDSHVGNWMRTKDGKLVSIDKGQAVKYFGQDRLDPHFHPNYYAREPIYNQLWRDHAQGYGQMHDPRTGELGAFVQQVQSLPDEKLKDMFRDYAHSAAQSGLLLNPDGDPSRKLGPRTLPANDPEAFLNALAERKNNLHKDLGDYYDRMSGGKSREFVGARGDRMPRHEEWMYDWDEDANDLQRSQLEMEPWQRGEYPRPEFGNDDPNFVTNNGYIRYHPDKIPGTLWQGDGTKRQWSQETPESLHNWQEQIRRKPGPGQMDLFSGEEHPAEPPPHPNYDEWRSHNPPRRPRSAAVPGKAQGERLYLPGDVADHLGVPRQTLMSWIYNNETPSPTHTSKPHKEMWDNLDVWDRWHNHRQSLKAGPRGYPQGWAAEFQTNKKPQRMLTIPDIAEQTGMSLSDVYKSVYRPQDSSAKLPRNSHFAVGDDNRGVHFWENLRPSTGKRDPRQFGASRHSAGISDQPDDVTGDYSLAEFLQWCAHNHEDPSRNNLAEYAAVSGMDTEDYLDIYLFLSDGMLHTGAIGDGPQRLLTLADIAPHLGIDRFTLYQLADPKKRSAIIPTPTHRAGPYTLWDDVEPWLKWNAIRKTLLNNLGQGGNGGGYKAGPTGGGWGDWAAEFQTGREPQPLYTAGQIADHLGVTRHQVKGWAAQQAAGKMKMPPPGHTHEMPRGDRGLTQRLWDDLDGWMNWHRERNLKIKPGSPELVRPGDADLLAKEFTPPPPKQGPALPPGYQRGS